MKQNSIFFFQTDHDPRNPAYIATQGSLPHTAPDFWQMIWEQGSVVMVMLTRLTENGNAMCHRYWPEEGSEVYHIYEVSVIKNYFLNQIFCCIFYAKFIDICSFTIVQAFLNFFPSIWSKLFRL